MSTSPTMIDSVTLEVPDPAPAERFHAALGVSDRVRVRTGDDATNGFRGYTLSLVVGQPNTVDLFVGTALDAGATVLKPVAKSLWGYGGVVQAPDGAVWNFATSSKKNTGPATREIDDLVLLLGVDDVKASKAFYLDHGFRTAKSFGGKYAEFEKAPGHITLGLNKRKALAKNSGVAPEGGGSHRIVIHCDSEPFTDPDGFAWQTAARPSEIG